eukprot:TRINITY_DN14976_c0_g2_i1.p2 TRINITY_DN14976_c0_g2~~TRINITY_DN14976_c0_g2_i1.p2  ORF type:complete len:157 (+),score=39.33 TRINITY_DN14976_c0_g2_i1:104-574(+)
MGQLCSPGGVSEEEDQPRTSFSYTGSSVGHSVRKLATPPTPGTPVSQGLPAPTPDDVAGQLLDAFDANGDGALNGSELYAALQRVLTPETARNFTRERSDLYYAQLAYEGYDTDSGLRQDDLARMVSEADGAELRRISALLRGDQERGRRRKRIWS